MPMASKDTWEKLRYFKPDSGDNWGDPDAISDELLFVLDDFRHFLALPVYVLHGTDGVHSKNSYHYKEYGACAVDVIIPDFHGHPVDLVLIAERMGFRGLGYYPHWKRYGVKGHGLHLDMRPLKKDPDGTYNYSHSRWMGVLIENEKNEIKQEYIGLTYENLIKYGGK